MAQVFEVAEFLFQLYRDREAPLFQVAEVNEYVPGGVPSDVLAEAEGIADRLFDAWQLRTFADEVCQ